MHKPTTSVTTFQAFPYEDYPLLCGMQNGWLASNSLSSPIFTLKNDSSQLWHSHYTRIQIIATIPALKNTETDLLHSSLQGIWQPPESSPEHSNHCLPGAQPGMAEFQATKPDTPPSAALPRASQFARPATEVLAFHFCCTLAPAKPPDSNKFSYHTIYKPFKE